MVRALLCGCLLVLSSAVVSGRADRGADTSGSPRTARQELVVPGLTEVKMLAPKSSVDDLMGNAIAIDGSTLAIGMPSDDSAGSMWGRCGSISWSMAGGSYGNGSYPRRARPGTILGLA